MPLKVHKNIESLVPYVPGKPIDDLERELGISRAVKLASNENPIGPSPKVSRCWPGRHESQSLSGRRGAAFAGSPNAGR
jgi:histidinol-phosphate aminotransferase